MRELFVELVADGQTGGIPDTGTRRRITLPWLQGKADAVIGMRRAGKTTLLWQEMKARVAAGWRREQLLYMSFEDERLIGLEAKDLGVIIDAFYRHDPSLRGVPCAFFLDEIQNVAGWERFVRRVLDTENVHVCFSGSSAQLLAKELATSMRGRALSTEVAPFSFAEVLDHHEVPIARGPVGREARTEMEHAFEQYLKVGGFPEVQKLDAELRSRVLRDYADVVLLRDVVERHNVSNSQALRALVSRLLAHPATQFTVSKFHNDLKSRGITVSRATLGEYLEYVTDAYLAHVLPIHSSSEKVIQTNPRKVYVVDHGLAGAHQPIPRPDIGHLLENAVYTTLRRNAQTVAYYLTRTRREVDFIVYDWAGVGRLVQVTMAMHDPQTRAREVGALAEAMQETAIRDATIVTLHDAGHEVIGDVEVPVVPAWRFALDAAR